MKSNCPRILFVFALMMASLSTMAQSPTSNKNYVMEKTVLVKDLKSKSQLTGQTVDNVNTQVTYYDGLGRPVQQVDYQVTQGKKDLVQHIEYDGFGRKKYSHLPYATGTTGTGDYRPSAESEQVAFYNNHFGGSEGNYAFSENEYDGSPLNRVVATYAPGDPWSKASSGGGKPVTVDYQTNEAGDEVILWEEVEGELIAYRYYGPGTLFKTVTTDEDDNQVIEFKDLQERTVLKQVEAPGNEWAKTYYVYDDFGNLIGVLPPEASKSYESEDLEAPEGFYLVTEDVNYSSIEEESGGKIAYIPTATVTVDPGTTLPAGTEIIPHGIMPDQGFLDQWVFQYQYDERQRMEEKKVPGAEPVYMVYDQLDRLVLTQDGNQRGGNKWTFTKYDAFDRPIITGEKVIPETVDEIRSTVKNQTILSESFTGSGLTDYSSDAYPTYILESEIHTITYYDHYDFTSKTFSLPSGIFDSTDNKLIPAATDMVKGQVTGTWVKILGTVDEYIRTYNFYDDRYRLVQSQVHNHKGGRDVYTNQYDFAGRIRKTHLKHYNPDGDASYLEIEEEYTYDHAGRLLEHVHMVENVPPVTIVSNTYNELGELVNKELAEGYEDIDYSYNIRGWLTKINDLSDGTQQLFEMDLAYNDSPNPQFNGNIGATSWKNPYESMVNHYDYTYDEMNRLTSALYDDGGASTMDFDVPQISYDLNGNIETLHRYGNHGDTANLKIDELNYTYAIGNQLSKVSDDSDRDSGFKDGTDQTTEYLYDANGNMIEDKNKGITSIEYNHLNLPKKVTFSPSKYIEYTYDASGAKLAQKLVDGGSTTVTDYIADFVYEDDKLQFLQHAEGRVVVLRDENGNINDVEYQYHLKDHLGNVRVTFKTEEETDVYQATFENDAATKSYESTYFSRYGEITRINADIFDHTDSGTDKTYSMRLNGTGNEVYGLAKSLEVKPGDVVEAEVYAKYLDPSTTGASGSAFAQLIEDLANNAPSVVVDGATAGSDPMPFAGLIGYGGDISSGPKAYLNIIVFDLNYQVVNTAYTPVTAAAEEDGTDVSHQYLNIAPVTIEEPGYVYIYLSNESSSPIEVFFDDFMVIHTNTDIVQKDDYYPFGHSFNSYQRVGAKPNDFKYNSFEEQTEFDWGVFDYQTRFYDPEIGRFLQVDPAADLMRRHSPYNYAFDNPIRFIDPDGMMPTDMTDPPSKDPRPKFMRVLPSGSVLKKIDEGLNLLSESFDYSVEGSASIGVGGKAKLGPITLEGEANLVSVSGKNTDDNLIEADVDVLNVEGTAGFASAEAEGSIATANGEVDVSHEGDIKTNFAIFDASGSASAGENGFDINLDNSTNLGAGGKIGPLKAEASINLSKATQGLSTLVEAGVDYLNETINDW